MMLLKTAGCLFLALLLQTTAVRAQESGAEDFASFLFRHGEYYRAATEYYRLLHAAEDSASRAGLLLHIARCHYAGADYARCLELNREHIAVFRYDPGVRMDMHLLTAKSLYHLDRYSEAVNIVEWSGIRQGNDRYAESRILLGVAHARMHNLPAADEAWSHIRSDVQWGNTAERLREALGGLERLPERSPTLAGMLSAVLPGAGYVYAGRPSTGIAALLINGLLAWAVSDAIGAEQYGLAATAGFLGLGWYAGNIIGSANAARAANDMAHRTFINRMLDEEHLQEYRK